MFKDCRILNKNTNENYFGQIDSEFEKKDFYELVEIPDDNKEYIFSGGKVIEKPVDIEKLKTDKLIENENAVKSKIYFTTSKGNIALQTIAGSLSSVLANYFSLNLEDYTGMLFTFEGEEIKDLTNQNFKSLYAELLQKYLAFDSKNRQIKNDINSAITVEQVEAVVISYEDL